MKQMPFRCIIITIVSSPAPEAPKFCPFLPKTYFQDLSPTDYTNQLPHPYIIHQSVMKELWSLFHLGVVVQGTLLDLPKMLCCDSKLFNKKTTDVDM